MLINCKLCNFEIDTDKIGISSYTGTISDKYICNCSYYSFVLNSNDKIESETITYKNFCLIYIPEYKTASVIKTGKQMLFTIPFDNLSNIEMEKFEHEDAVKWFSKLEKYCLFQ